jgi:hypothetical protein
MTDILDTDEAGSAVTLWTRILNLGRDANYRDMFYFVLLSPSDRYRYGTSLARHSLLSKPFLIRHSFGTPLFDAVHACSLAFDSIVKTPLDDVEEII